MNNNYYSNTISTNNYRQLNNDMLPNNIPEQLYIDAIIKENEGKFANIYITVPGSVNWQDKVFEGIIERTGIDHVLLSNTNTGEKYLIPLMYVVFITFNN